jgi:SAM-dependent methyltransferase
VRQGRPGFLRRIRLWIKLLMWPGTNWVSRDKSRVVHHLLRGKPDEPVRTLDCGCGNAYFAYQAVQRDSHCVGITIHEWERRNCEEMREFLGIPAEQMRFCTERLDRFADHAENEGAFDQVLMFDVIEHILDAQEALRQIHVLLGENGFLYLTTPNRDWPRNASKPRVSRAENGWHVRNGYTFEQLESLLDECGFEPIDRLRFGTLGSTLVMKIQHGVFRSLIDPLTLLFFPVLKLISVVLSPWSDTHTIFVLARKKAI